MLIWAGGAGAQTPGTAKIAIDNAPPYRIVELQGGKHTFSGIYVDIVRELAARCNIRLEFVEVPFRRALMMAEEGQSDMMLGPSRSPEREDYMSYLVGDLGRENEAFYLSEGALDIHEYEDLAGMKIGVLRGAKYFDRFDNDKSLLKLELGDYPRGVKLLQRGKLDALIMPVLLGDYLVARTKAFVRKSTYQVEGRASHFTVSRRSPLMSRIGELERTLAEMQTDGFIDLVKARYAE
ncbi:MAG: transporter substrate-binding domain-containing protein [Alphaproteobacteria bacterium]|nr:transporter substrate-binding domain-containing protein [Alphaproteobacteria bacterium]MBF0250682.1 transporter substrate-binding domain-containing protein [Alphaproteobacteria bacterium]